MTTYLSSCPICGGPLQSVDHAPTTAPWLCRPCRRGWWAAELSQEARAIFRPTHGDFRPHLGVKEAVQAERELAHQRGTSLRPDQKVEP